MNERFTITNVSKGKLPRLPFDKIKEAALGKHYALSVVIVGNARSRALNRHYRGKDKPTNVLSFPLEQSAGELFLNAPYIKREALDLGRSYKKHLACLFIHGLLHLKGMLHGSTMEGKEKKFQRDFKIS